ncbi:MAG: hypothetical protein HC888_02040 [Candidatus Competibacteraceae bacterium]|nr:hypothetical protein [Candidatus Competibacteraceae bacterium]
MISQERARLVGYVGGEHLLYGLASQRNRIASTALHHYGVTATNVDCELAILESGLEKVDSNPEDLVPFSPGAKQILGLAWQAATELNHNYVSTEHILLGLLRENGGMSSTILTNLGVDSKTLEDYVLDIVLKKVPFVAEQEEVG